MRCAPSAVSRRPALAFIVVTVALDVMGIGLLLPVLPLLIGEFTPNRDAQALWYGALIMSFAQHSSCARRCSGRCRIASAGARSCCWPSPGSARCSSLRRW